MDVMETENAESLLLLNIREQARAATLNLLPCKSRQLYEKEYNQFDCWRKEKCVCGVNEEILLAYFNGKNYKSSTLWTKYLMLKSTLDVYENVNISRFLKLKAYLKQQTRSYKPKKARILEKEHIDKFLSEAPDTEYLLMKAVLVLGVMGACRCDELLHLTINNIQDKGSYLHVTIPDTKTNKSRSFAILPEGFTVNVFDIIKKYSSLRPKNVGHRRFFLNYRDQKCTIQQVGINTLSKIPRLVASYLKLSEPGSYTGHCYRRLSATLLANGGGDIINLKRHGGWKSSDIAEGYIEDSIQNKIKIAKTISGTDTSAGDNRNSQTFVLSQAIENVEENMSSDEISIVKRAGVHFHAAVNNLTLNIYNVDKTQI